jgi:hypothetical protein
VRASVVASVVLLLGAAPGAGQNVGCTQGRSIVAEVQALYRQAAPDHRQILGLLATARRLCPSLGEAWKYSYCSALALGDRDKKAGYYKQQAVFNGVADLSCPAGIAEAARPAPGFIRRKHALIIGIGQFQDRRIRQLQFAAKDAEDLADALRDPRWGSFPPEDITVLTDAAATRNNILDALQKLLLTVQEEDLVLLFVSSHGSAGEEREQGLAGLGHIITWDTDADRIYHNALEFKDFKDKVALLKARRKVLLLDTCFSGQLKEGQRSLVVEGGISAEQAQLFLSGEGTYVITSSSARERSWESDKLHNGVFTHFLIEALKQGKDGTPPTIRQVFGYLAPRVRDAVAREKTAAQNPQMFPRDAAEDLRIGAAPHPGGMP